MLTIRLGVCIEVAYGNDIDCAHAPDLVTTENSDSCGNFIETFVNEGGASDFNVGEFGET